MSISNKEAFPLRLSQRQMHYRQRRSPRTQHWTHPFHAAIELGEFLQEWLLLMSRSSERGPHLNRSSCELKDSHNSSSQAELMRSQKDDLEHSTEAEVLVPLFSSNGETRTDRQPECLR